MRVGADVEAALAVWVAVQRAASQPPGAARTTRMRTALRASTSLLLVSGDPVVGLLLVELVGRRLELTMLAVEPAHERTGVARALVGGLLARYPDVACWSATPEVYEVLGFVRTGAERDGAVELRSP